MLVDLCGQLAGNRLPLFASRCAPVQVTYLGYPGTTGTPNMDYAISDDWLDPAREGNAHYSETLVRLESTCFAFQPPSNAPSVREARNPSIVFGSFNTTRKISESVLDAWARVLLAVPGSGLIMQARGLAEPARQAQLLAFFAARGVAPERITLHGFVAFQDYLAMIAQVDICLDPWPWNGHMTTLNCLWMGVPVLSLAGRRRSGRMGKAILSEVGLAEWVATSEADYIDKAVRFAQDPERLDALRAGMRQRLLASALCDGKRLASAMEHAYLTLVATARAAGDTPAVR